MKCSDLEAEFPPILRYLVCFLPGGILFFLCVCVYVFMTLGGSVCYLRVVGQVDLSGDVVHSANPLRKKCIHSH